MKRINQPKYKYRALKKTKIKYKICSVCGEKIPSYLSELIIRAVDPNDNNKRKYYCKFCFETEVSHCIECNRVFDTDHLTIAEGGTVCAECLKLEYTACDSCRQMINNDNINEVDDGESYVCEECLSDYYDICHDCDQYYHLDYLHGVGDDDDLVCESCFEEYSVCDLCNSYFLGNDLEYFETSDDEPTHLCECCVVPYFMEYSLDIVSHLAERTELDLFKGIKLRNILQTVLDNYSEIVNYITQYCNNNHLILKKNDSYKWIIKYQSINKTIDEMFVIETLETFDDFWKKLNINYIRRYNEHLNKTLALMQKMNKFDVSSYIEETDHIEVPLENYAIIL